MTQWLVQTGRDLALTAIVGLGIPNLLRPRGQPSVSALLFHRFFDPGERRHCGVERLRRQLEWLRANYTPISLPQFIDGLRSGVLPDRAVLVTADDGRVDLLDVFEEFRAFEVPLAVFVCAGWTASASKGNSADLVARAAVAIQWHEQADIEVRLGHDRVFALSQANKAQNIDRLIAERDELAPDLEELCQRVEAMVDAAPQCCTWSDLQGLLAAGVSIGAHSVTHVRMSTASAIRRRFEIAESKRLCELMLGPCRTFAYPYGTPETQTEATRVDLESAGYAAAFLTHSEFITAKSDVFALPRIAMPDLSISLREFKARAGGAGIALRRLKALVAHMRP